MLAITNLDERVYWVRGKQSAKRQKIIIVEPSVLVGTGLGSIWGFVGRLPRTICWFVS